MLSSKRTVVAGTAVCASALVAISGCSSSGPVADMEQDFAPRAFQSPRAWRVGDRPVTQPIAMSADTPEGEARLIGRQKLSSTRFPEPGSGVLGGSLGEVVRVTLATNEANPSEIIRTLVEEFLGQSYVLDPKVASSSDTITMAIDEEMTRAGVRDLLGGLATIYGWVIEERDGVLYFRTLGSGNQAASMGRSDAAPLIRYQQAYESDTPSVRIKAMQHMAPADAAKAIENLMSPGGSVVASGRSVLIVDTVRQTNRLSRILDALDTPAFDGVEIHTYRLAHRAPSDVSALLTNIASSARMASEVSAMSFVPVPGTKDLMVIARDPSLLKMAKDLINVIDRPAGEEVESTYLYRVQNYEPQELVRLVREFFVDRIEPAQTGGRSSGVPDNGEQKMRIVFDEQQDLMLIRATPEDYADLMGVLTAIDRPRQQVMLNTIIAEVVLENRLEFGVDAFLNALNEDGTVLDLFATPGGVASPTGTITLLGASGQAVIQALRTEADVDVLSQPRLVVRDRFQAEFQVGGEVPVLQGDLNSDGGSDTTQIRRDITYRDTGLTLTITPRINESGMVTLVIDQEINEVGNSGELGPEFTTRTLLTEVTVPHGQTILLAGIIENSIRKTTRKTPVLGEIPIVGIAFQNIEDVKERRELLLAITPTIVASPEQAQGTLGEFFTSTRALRAAMEGYEDSLQRGVLNSESLNLELGGFGEEIERLDDGYEEDEIERRREMLIEPASSTTGTTGGGMIGFMGFAPMGALAAPASDDQTAEG